MTETAQLMLGVMTYLLLKHAVADFFLQNAFQHKNKGRYGHPGGILHSLIHIAMTAPIFLIWTLIEQNWMIAILTGEFLIHYHIDWIKENVVRSMGLAPTGAKFWNAMGVDQLMHGWTYVAIVAALVMAPGMTT